MKQITQQQIDMIIAAMYQANVPVQMHEQLKQMLNSLPEIKKSNEQ